MRKHAIAVILLLLLLMITACDEATPATPIDFDHLAYEATDIVRARVYENQGDDPDIIRLFVQGTYKGNYNYRDIIELYHPHCECEIFLNHEWGHFLIFLRSSEGERSMLLNQNYSVYKLDDCAYSRFVFINACVLGDPNFFIHYRELWTLWERQIQAIRDEYGSLDFVEISERPGSPPFHSRVVERESLVYPMIITSMDELNVYMEHYSDYVLWFRGTGISYYRNDVIFGEYTDAFFEDRFLFVFNITEPSGSIGHRVEAVLKNGTVIITRRVIPPGFFGTADLSQWLVVLEIENSTIPEQFNFFVMNRWI
ncbi:MAG: hypothetical protein FWC92_07720 [Defluviitaleaceae bacterium]|nr:hypothetical protein [Defluviitaleaceae bacterium]